MEFDEKDFLMLSGIQHFAFCRRQWALIHIEQLWEDNLRTTEGNIIHDNCHDSYFSESRGEVIIARGVPIFSKTMGVSGECDVVEYRKDPNGIELVGKKGKFTVYPVEYKRGEPKDTDIDILQLTAQAICLSEMLLCEINEGAIYYASIKKRQRVTFTDDLKNKVRALFSEMHRYIKSGHIPNVKATKQCNACSLKNLCMPKLMSKDNVTKYIRDSIYD